MHTLLIKVYKMKNKEEIERLCNVMQILSKELLSTANKAKALINCTESNLEFSDRRVIESVTCKAFYDYWITEGNLDKAIKDNQFNCRDHYLKILEVTSLNTNTMSHKKYYYWLKLMLNASGIDFSFCGFRDKKTIVFN